MMKYLIQLFILTFIFIACSPKLNKKVHQSDITVNELKQDISYLASDELKGRKPGTKEGALAASYIRKSFQQSGLQLLGDNGYQSFQVVTDFIQTKGNLYKHDRFSGVPNKDFAPFPFSAKAGNKSEVVFVGYGIKSSSKSLEWNDYDGVNPKGKWVMLLMGTPDIKNAEIKEYENLNIKVRTALDHGAAGVLVVNPVDDKLLEMKGFMTGKSCDIPVLNIRRTIADYVLLYKQASIENLVVKIKNAQKSIAFELPTVVYAQAGVELKKSKTQNVIGFLEGSDPVLKNEYIVIGAHYDHLGMGGENSNSRAAGRYEVHNGADDNASGAAGLLELAEELLANRKNIKRSIVFIAFGAEEMGLIGSKYYIENPLKPLNKTVCMFNFDMIGRMKKDTKKISVMGCKSAKESENIIRKQSEKYQVNMECAALGYGYSDHTHFYDNHIPVIYFTTGIHDDYHTPEDDANLINYAGEKQVLDFAYGIIEEVSNLEKPMEFQSIREESRKTSRSSLKVTFGIMPSYTSDKNDGLLVDGVSKGGPAEKGGMLKGDKIISINDKEVNNIYDYMYRLKELNEGDKAKVEVVRGKGKKILILEL